MPGRRNSLREQLHAGQQLARSGNKQAALEHFAALRQKYPDKALVWLHSAFLLDRMGREAAAIPLYQHALFLGLRGSDARDALVCLASSLRNIGKPNEAMLVLEQAIEQFPRDVVVSLFFALMACHTQRKDDALRVLAMALLRESKSPALDRYRGTLRGKFAALLPGHDT